MKKVLALICVSVIIMSCEEEPLATGRTTGTPDAQSDWSIPVNWVFDGGPGIDGIPSIDDPKFVSYAAMGDQIRDFELAVGVKVDDEIRVYPHKILDYHEIVNDRIGQDFFAVTYCPLTGTAIGWDRELNGSEVEFGVSGLLYNNNLMPYDRKTNSIFSQMLNQGVRGPLLGDSVTTFNVVEMTYGAWRSQFPNARVLSFETGVSRDYNVYPYGNYRSVEDLLFPQARVDKRIPAKERVLGVTINGRSRVYQFDSVQGGLVNDTFQGTDIVVVRGPGGSSTMAAFIKQFNGQELEFESPSDMPNAVLKDQNGNYWNIFGESIAGPNVGQRLNAPTNYMGFWFAWAGFNETISIF